MKWLTLGAVALVCVAAVADEQGQIDFANGLFQRGFYEEAAEEFQKYLVDFPQGAHIAVAQYRLGESLFGLKRYEPALAALNAALAAQGLAEETRQRAALRQGEALYYLKKYEEAEPALQVLAGAESAAEVRAEALYFLGKVQFDRKNAEAALKTFRTLAESMPDSHFAPFSHYQMGFVYLGLDRPEDAASEFSAVAGSTADEALRMESRFRAAEIYDKMGWFDTAVGAYEQLRSEFPASAYARRADYGLAWALYHAGDYPRAAEAAKGFLAANPDAPEVPGMMYLQANSLQQQKAFDEAIALYGSIRDKYPDSEFAGRSQYKIGWAQYLKGDTVAAKTTIEAFLKTPEESPLRGDAAFLRGNILLAEGNLSDACQEFQLVAEKYPQSEFAPEALYKAGECLAKLGREEEAVTVFEAFAQRFPDHALTEQAVLRAGDAEFFGAAFEDAVAKYTQILAGTPSPPVEEETLYRLALTYHNMANYEASGTTFQKLLEKFPASTYASEAHFRVGDYLLKEANDAVKSIEHFQQAYDTAADPGLKGKALQGLALARYETKDYDGASNLFLQLMQEYPSVTLNETTYAWVGQRLFDQGRFAEAVAGFEALLKGNPSYPNPERVLFKIAEAHEKAGQADLALATFTRVKETAPTSTLAIEATYRIARLLEARNEMDQALAMYEQAANANVSDAAARARFRIGELHEERGEHDEAARSFMRVAILFLHEELSPESLLRAGRNFEKANTTHQAIQAYEEIIETYPDSTQAAAAQERLTALNGTAPAAPAQAS
jgi:TolA-binding protein